MNSPSCGRYHMITNQTVFLFSFDDSSYDNNYSLENSDYKMSEDGYIIELDYSILFY